MPETEEPSALDVGGPSKTPRIAASSLVAAGIFLSRIAGLIRDRVLAGYFGTSLYADVVRAGLRMPNLLQNLLGEGTLSASFIPVYSELLEQGRRKEAGRVAGAIFALLFALAGGLALLGVLFAPQLTDFFLPGFEGEQRALTIRITRIIFPMTGVLVLSAWALGILNSHRHFFVSYVAPVFWNGAIIGTLLIFGGRMDAPSLVVAFAWGALLGGILQFGIQLPWVIRLDRSLRVSWNTRMEPVREAARNAGPAILGRGVVQLSGYVDMVLASFLVTGSFAIMSFAITLYVLPISLFGMSVAAAELPELSRQRSGSPEALRLRTNAALQRIAFYIVPSFVAIVLLGDALVAALYQTGEFDRIDTLLVYLTLVGFSIGLLASTATRLFSSTFFALHDTATPARTAAVRVAAAAILGFLLMIQFEAVEIFGMEFGPGIFADIRLAGQPLGVVGLAVGAGVAAWMEWWFLRRALARRIGTVGASAGPLARMFAAALAAAAAGWGVRWILPEIHPIPAAVFIFMAFGAVYFGSAAALGLKEMEGLVTRINNIRGRRR
ncbi:MAG TPA: murein biosynthesis integral membrane protein MurJ [Longimicrobiaceae bacterium]|nr:murein biosynthesis integral membrane protein MurJ [Longimicrobiaceae bacterium]